MPHYDRIDFNLLDVNELRKLSEAELRKLIVIPLLRDYLRAENIIDSCGTNEYGIDVYFEWYDIFSHVRYFGIQIKKGNLIYRNRPDKDPNIITICNQIKSAFSKEIRFADSNNGRVDKNIDGFYIIISGETNDQTKTYIYQERKSYPYIHIIDGNELLKIIKNRELYKRSRDNALLIIRRHF
ncbi:MAG: hypothetical protein GF353_13175 [Candidatus Lokiarchaeota archaeon]|nr:hypothetical protein [Candidatus Lokiarchaeota archaeon]